MLTRASCFVQMRLQGMAERCNAAVVVCIWVLYACVGGIRRDYLASISRTALRACCEGANDWASRAEPLPASAVGEHAWREN